MFVTNLPARVVEAQYLEVASTAAVTVGKDGLGVKIKAHGDGLVLTSCGQNDKLSGYKMSDNEVIGFSGRVSLYNSDSANPVSVSVIITDSI